MAEWRSLRLVLAAVVAGVVLATTGGSRPWATVEARLDLRSLGSAPVGHGTLTGNALAPLSALALLGLVLALGIAPTRGRGRLVVGAALTALGVVVAVVAVVQASRAAERATMLARQGRIAGLPAAADTRTTTSPAGPVLVVAGGALLALAGLETLRRGASWPALGAAFRAPPDRATHAPRADRSSGQPSQPAGDGDAEPPWQGD